MRMCGWMRVDSESTVPSSTSDVEDRPRKRKRKRKRCTSYRFNASPMGCRRRLFETVRTGDARRSYGMDLFDRALYTTHPRPRSARAGFRTSLHLASASACAPRTAFCMHPALRSACLTAHRALRDALSYSSHHTSHHAPSPLSPSISGFAPPLRSPHRTAPHCL